ncbi:MAG: tRNA pseudouridine(55) synthase TruB [Lachnospiraceae bacterium]|nr:tRNA pseudouridine(55) synthase TruB [Lachnospiraceae bacterium]
MSNVWNGLLCVNKEAGYTSNDVVAKLRGILKQRKIGHTGTLDPGAVGLLVVCLGSATRVVDLLTEHSKEYLAVVQLGVTTDTQDMTGEVLERRDCGDVTHERLVEALQAFKGGYDQVPPMYSAVKVHGRRLYQLAREGKTVERKPRRVEIETISIADDHLLLTDHLFTMDVKCSKGTYIRTLTHDIGERLGCGAAMGLLIRTAVGSFHVDGALTLSQIETCRDDGTLADHILPVEELFRDLDRIEVEPAFRRQMENGNPFGTDRIAGEPLPDKEDGTADEDGFRDGERVRAYCDGEWFGIYRYSAAMKRFVVEKFFYENHCGSDGIS